MSDPLAVHVTTGLVSGAAVLASLPRSYVASTEVAGAVDVVDGSPGWPALAGASLDAGAVAVVVVAPQPADVAALRDRPGLVVLDSPWAANPAVAPAREAFGSALAGGTRLECRTCLPTGAAGEAALLDQLTLLRALVGPVTDVRVLSRSRTGYAAEGTVAGLPVDLALVCTDAVPGSTTVRLPTADGAVTLTLPGGATARPAELVVTGPDGARTTPTRYETGHRATWRRLHTLLRSGSTAPDLDDLATDQDTTRTAFQHDEG